MPASSARIKNARSSFTVFGRWFFRGFPEEDQGTTLISRIRPVAMDHFRHLFGALLAGVGGKGCDITIPGVLEGAQYEQTAWR